MRKILFVVLPVILLLGTLVAVVLIIRGREAAQPAPGGEIVPPSAETAERARSALDVALAECAGDAECIETTTTRFAAMSQVADLCGKIDDPAERDGCFLEVALRQSEPEICGKIEDGGRAASCRDKLLRRKAGETGDIALCAGITSSSLLRVCVELGVGAGTDRSVCDALTDRSREVCFAAVITNIAARENNPSVCDEIQDLALRSACSGGGDPFVPLPSGPADLDGDALPDEEEEKLGTDPFNTDSDNDGLSDAEEVQKYKTDPLNPDTDADGFDDGTEVQNGFNPLGEGRL